LTSAILESEVVILKPFEGVEDFNYMLSLVEKYKYNNIDQTLAKEIIVKYGLLFWVCYDKVTNTKGGVVYISIIPNIGFTLDAYRDDKLIKEKMIPRSDYSLQTGLLALDYFFNFVGDTIFTTHSIKNRAATMVCKKLGFEEVERFGSPFGPFILLSKSKGGNNGN
jgi:hypothetical protein